MPGSSILRLAHAICGRLALATIASFFAASAAAEAAGGEALILTVKTAILWGLAVLIPALAATGISGSVLAGGKTMGLAGLKIRRTRRAAANGLLVLVPCAVLLQAKAAAGDFDIWFAVLQGAEFLAGALNMMLLGLNMRDGIRLSAMLRRESAWKRGRHPG